MTRFNITPYKGVGLFEFGMTEAQVASTWGPPQRRIRNWKGDFEELRQGAKVCYDTGGCVVEVVLFPPAAALFEDTDLLSLPDPVAFLAKHDPQPFEAVGITIFFRLGISVTGFGGDDDSDKAVGAFAEGRWDTLRDRLSPRCTSG